MDFVDLDKVLDQFEEEEKAAEEILPGQEIKPSGYAEYLVSHQDRPWESLSLGQPVDASTKQIYLNPQAVVYDDPYDSFDRAVLEGHTGLKQLSFPAKNSYVDHQVNQDGNTLGQSLHLEQDLAEAKLKEEKIEAYLPPLHLNNGVGQVSGLDVNGWVDGGKGEDGERRGLIASQPASIQTDMLSPASEQELLSYPLPKSDILVEGHVHSMRNTQSLPAPLTAPCLSGDRDDSTTSYASLPSKVTAACSREQRLQDTGNDSEQHLTTEVSGSQSLEHQAEEMEAEAADVAETETSNCSRTETDVPASESSASSAAAVLLSDKSVDQQGTDACLQNETAAPDREGTADGCAVEAVGFDAGECELDKDEVDAYLEELESTILSDDGDISGQTAACEVGHMTVDSLSDNVSRDTEQTTAAVVHIPADGSENTTDTCTVQAGERLEDGLVGDSHVEESQSFGDVSKENNGDVTDFSAKSGNTSVIKEPTNCISKDNEFQHRNTLADLGGLPSASVRTDLHPGVRMETEENSEGVTNMNVSTDGSADKTSLEVSDVGKTDMNSGMNLNKLVNTVSLEFPVAGNKSGVSSVVKGKLEIEGLLDEIVAARLAQKTSEMISAEPTQPEQLAVDQSLPRDGDVNEKIRTQGWGPDGSMVCSRARETSSASPEVTSPPESGSPSPTLGIGARPKDPSQMKKNRPNSLLGLSKISLTSPFSPPQQTAGPVIEVMLPAAHQAPAGTEVADASRECRTQNHGVGGRQLGVSPPPVGGPPPEGSAVIPMDGTPAPSGMDTLVDETVESAMMRRPDMRGDSGIVGEGEEASSGVHRPQSWSPSTLSSPPTQRTKRPTSLNLPVRQDRMGSLSPDGDTSRTRKTGMMVESGGSSEAGSSAEEESVGIGGTDGCPCGDLSVHDPQQEQEGAGAAAELPMETPPPSILHLNLGKIAPTWLPDADAPACMECSARFTFTKRRHHCRACGKIFCSTCCGQKSRLTYLENKEGRVCVSCHHILSSGSSRKSEPKQVMFSDGIRPGGDLTELDGSDQARIPPRRSGRAQKKVEKQQGEHSSAKTRRLRGSDGMRNPCLIPDEGLPPVVVHTDDKGEVSLSENTDPASLMAQIKNEEACPVTFAINLNLFVQVKIINLDCCLKRVVWCFTTQGMVTVGQEELVIVLETLPDEDTVPHDIFCHLSTVYEEAGKGNTVSHMGHSIFNQPFLDSSTHGGFLYLRSTFQCTNKLLLPSAPFLFPILLHKWETPWAKVFPIRLMLRLGAEHRYYPCPLVSIRNRKPVFFEIGHTIMNLLADFRNFQYMLQQIRGVSIHMEDQKTFINFPRNRYQDVMKVVSSSNEHVMALGASFSLEADSHLVCIQNEDGNYQTQAINIQNKPRQVTGASFVVFNGALKTSSGLRAKSSIVEDGLMVQILPEMMGALKQSLKDMKDFAIPCGSLALPQPEEVVSVRWVDDDKNVNIGVKSPVDGMSLDGVESVPVHNATDYVGERYAIRWTQLFFLQTESGTSRWEPVDLSRVAETLANAVCIALTPHLQKLKEASLTKIGLRVTLQPDSVGYEVGSNSERLPDFYINDLDNALIPVIHSAMTTNQDGPIVLELHLYLIH